MILIRKESINLNPEIGLKKKKKNENKMDNTDYGPYRITGAGIASHC